jgi:hemolysin activation/secretion protein
MPPDAGTLLNEQQRNQLAPLTPPRIPEKEEAERPPLQETGEKFLVKGFRFSGIAGMMGVEADLNDYLKSFLGQEMGVQGLNHLATRVTKYLRNSGWFLARAYIPEQQVQEGIVEIAVVAGKLEGKPAISGEKLRIGQSRLQDFVNASAPSGGVANMNELERGLLVASDIPGVSTQATVEPGATAGSSALVVKAKEGPLVSGMAWGDNYGSRFTGFYRGNNLLQINDPFRYGDQLNLAVTGNTNYQYGQAAYSAPLGYNGLRAGVSYSESRYEIDRSMNPLDLNGGTRDAGANLNYPIIRSRLANLWAGAGYDWKSLWDDALGQKTDNKLVNVGNVRLNGDMLDTFLDGGYTTASVGGSAGSLDLSHVLDNLEADQLTAHTQGGYGKFVYSATRLQRLSDHINLFASVTGQQAFNNLDSSEKFILGGPNGVRAYPVGEASGDSGGIGTLEVRYDFREIPKVGVPQLVGFYDLGWTQLHQFPWMNSGTAFGNKNSYVLSGGGVGVNVTNSSRYAVRLAWAHTVGANPGRSLTGLDADGKDDSNRFWFQVVVMY